jgi:hypothetical protein
MWDKRRLALVGTLMPLLAGAERLAGQMLENVEVNIINENLAPAEIQVVDDVCEVIAFEGNLMPNSSTTVSLCPDRDQRGHMTIYDRAGRAQRYANLLPSTVALPMR